MTTTSVAAASGIVPEPLTKENYENWSTLVRNYLMGNDLWDVVVSDPNLNISKFSEFQKKNANGLHIIQLACGSQNLSHIRQVETAYKAWNKLRVIYSPYLETDPEILQGVVEDSLEENKDLHMHVLRGDWRAAELFLNRNREAIYSKSSWDRTVLHIAGIAGHGKIVEKLVDIGGDKLIKIQDKNGYTALALAARLAGNIDIGKYIISTAAGEGQDVLTMKTEDGEIPVLLAAANGHKHMTSYLYKKTPLKELEGRNGFLLLTRCIAGRIFDVALDILRRKPEMPHALDLAQTYTPLALPGLSPEDQPLYALACQPFAFPSGRGYGLLQRFIYKILILGSETSQRIVKDDDHVTVIVSEVDPEEEGHRKSSFMGRFCGWLLNFWPVEFLGQILLPFYMFIQNSILLKLPRISKIYNQKHKHVLVGEILSCLSERVLEMNESQLREALAYDAMLQAAKHGIIEFIDEMRNANPNLLWAIDQNKRGIFTHAVMNHRKEVFKLIHKAEVNGRKDIIKGRPDASGNTILHMAAYLGPSSDLDNRFGPALQMQREIQWFKMVESNVHSRCRKAINPEGKKAAKVFKEEHRELVNAGEKWAKETAGQFALVGTLVITIMFAAAFTIPGENNPNDKILTIFIISDAVSLFTSSASVLLFIGILTSRYDENDFHWSLPLKLLFGLFFLFMSVISMIFAFCSSLSMYEKGHQPVKIAAISLGSIPLFCLVPSMSLFCEILKSTIIRSLISKFT